MCQSKSHGHHHHHQHRSQLIDQHSAHRGAVEPPRLTRRQALRRLKTAGLAAAASGLPWGTPVRAVADDGQAAAAGPAVPKLFDLKQVAPGIYGAIAKPTAVLDCNAAVIVNRDHVLVVDTHSKPSAAKALIRQIRDEITRAPGQVRGRQPPPRRPRHGERSLSRGLRPQCRDDLVSKDGEWLEKLGVPRMQETLDGLPKQIADFRAKLEASRDESERAPCGAHRGDLRRTCGR